MTLIVGIRCSNGVVIGTDSAATFGPFVLTPTISQLYQQKISIIDDRIIIAGTGAIGLGQRFTAIAKQHWGDAEFRNKSDVEIGKILSQGALT